MKMIRIEQPSVQSLFIEMWFGNQLLSSGTAFLVRGMSQPVLITNRHNVTGRDQNTDQPLAAHGGVPDKLVILHNKSGPIGSWIKCEEPLYDENQSPRWYEHPRMGPSADFVALPLSETKGIRVFPYDLSEPGPDIAVGPSEIVSVVGFPFGMTVGGAMAIWATGFVASEPNLPDEPTFLIDCRSRPGQSGSAVICYRTGAVTLATGTTAVFGHPVTRLLGVYSGRVNPESDLGIVWKASAISELMEIVP